MRDYAKLAPTFWTGTTGKALRRRGSEGVIVALYLVSSPHSNMLGLFYQPIMYIAHETGLGIEGASKGLNDCVECGFCSYDADTEMVFVHEMAAWQIADSLSAADKRCRGIQKDYEALPDCPFLAAWFDRYAQAFHLTNRRSFEVEKPEAVEGASQAPSKPHRSQEQEQEQEQEQKTPAASRRSASPAKPAVTGFEAFYAAYPRKVKPKDARKAWDKLKPDAALQARILAAIAAQKLTPQWTKDAGQYIPHPSTWLNAGEWDNEVAAPGQSIGEAWHESTKGIRAKGIELGVGDWDQDAFDHGRGINWITYRAKVLRAASMESVAA